MTNTCDKGRRWQPRGQAVGTVDLLGLTNPVLQHPQHRLWHSSACGNRQCQLAAVKAAQPREIGAEQAVLFPKKQGCQNWKSRCSLQTEGTA